LGAVDLKDFFENITLKSENGKVFTLPGPRRGNEIVGKKIGYHDGVVFFIPLGRKTLGFFTNYSKKVQPTEHIMWFGKMLKKKYINSFPQNKKCIRCR